MKSVYYLHFSDLVGVAHFIEVHRKAAVMNMVKALVKMSAHYVIVTDRATNIIKTWGIEQ